MSATLFPAELLAGGPPTTEEVTRLVVDRHGGGGWLVWTELKTATGMLAHRSIDVFALHQWPSHGHMREAYEVKVSRGDWLRELKDPTKRREALLWSNHFWFVTTPGLIKPAELPPECGLMEARAEPPQSGWRREGQRLYLHTVVHAPWRDTPPPSWGLLVSMVRSYRPPAPRGARP